MKPKKTTFKSKVHQHGKKLGNTLAREAKTAEFRARRRSKKVAKDFEVSRKKVARDLESSRKKVTAELKSSRKNWRENSRDFLDDRKTRIKRFFTFKIVRDPDLIQAYIGNQYPKFVRRPFNFAAFFFTVIYLLFRKLYLAGVVMFILNILLINLVRGHVLHFASALTLGLVVNLILGLLIGFCVNRYYLFAAGFKIGRLKIKYPDRSQAEMRGICEAKGGTNSIALTVGFLAKIISSVVMVINMLFSEAVLAIETPFTSIVKNIRTEVEQIKTDLQTSVENGANSFRNTLNKAFENIENDLKHAEETHKKR